MAGFLSSITASGKEQSMWTELTQGYRTAETDEVILAAASEKLGVPVEQLELRRNDGCVLVRIRKERDDEDTNEG